MEKHEKNEPSTSNPRRAVLKMAIATMLNEKGFAKADRECVESLTEMLQSLISEIAVTSRSYAELSGRTQCVVGDVVVSLVNLGISIQGITTFGKREGRPTLPNPQPLSQQKQLNLLQAGTKLSHPPHIPHHLPVLPDPHAYIRTPTHKQPVTEYEAIREKASNQKRDIEKALTKFLAKTSETYNLFSSEDASNQMFPLIACKPAFPPYLAALNPTDQVFDFEELEYHYLVANRTEDPPSKDDDEDDDDDDMKDTKSEAKDEKSPLDESANDPGPSGSGGQANRSPIIDNPFLKAAKGPKRTKTEASVGLNFN